VLWTAKVRRDGHFHHCKIEPKKFPIPWNLYTIHLQSNLYYWATNDGLQSTWDSKPCKDKDWQLSPLICRHSFCVLKSRDPFQKERQLKPRRRKTSKDAPSSLPNKGRAPSSFRIANLPRQNWSALHNTSEPSLPSMPRLPAISNLSSSNTSHRKNLSLEKGIDCPECHDVSPAGHRQYSEIPNKIIYSANKCWICYGNQPMLLKTQRRGSLEFGVFSKDMQ